VEVSISDTGVGIPPELGEEVFQLFRIGPSEDRDSSRHQGFGLWWIKTFLMDIGAEIKFESQVGLGTTFSVRLPPAESCN
jgi:two-component system OmpR family sensor kinase